MSATQIEMASSQPSQPVIAASEPELPELTYGVAETEDEKRDTLKLVADTIAQQRQVASRTIIFHPVCLGPFMAVVGTLIHLHGHDLARTIILLSGVGVAYLAAVQYYTYSYLQRAEDFKWTAFITPDADKPKQQDTVMYARYGEAIIGALVLRLDQPKQTHAQAKKLSAAAVAQRGKGCTAQIRALATKLRYRGTGIGGDMLREAVALTHKTLGLAATVEFASDHAHAIDTTQYFTAPFAHREKRARLALAQALEQTNAPAKQ